MTASAPKQTEGKQRPQLARRRLPVKQDWGQLGPAMRALPNDEWRQFCHSLVTGKPGHGRYARAARAAGFGKDSTKTNLAKIAWRMAHDERMIAAIAEECRKYLRGAHPEAVTALLAMVRNQGHRDHMRAVSEVLLRTDPVVSRQDISVLHKIVDPDQEGLEELRAMRALGTSREKLLELFGGNGLARLERLEAADTVRRANEARVIDGEVIEVSANG